MVESALSLIDIALESTKEQIVGLYFGADCISTQKSSNINDKLNAYLSEVPHLVQVTFNAIKEKQPNAVMAIVRVDLYDICDFYY